MVNLATTEVQFITSGIGLMIYGMHLHASGKSLITLLVIKYIADAFGPENASIYFFCLMWHLETVGKLECHLMRWPQHYVLFSIGTRSRFYSSSTAFVVHYTSSACWGSEWAEKRKCMQLTCILHLLKASNIIRAYKESCLPSRGRCLFRLLICLLLHTNFNKIINFVQTFIL